MRNIVVREGNLEIDEGIMFGRGVFETILTKETPLFYGEHLNRLKNSIDKIGVKKLSIEEERIIKNKIKQMNVRECVIKIVITDKNIILSTRQNPYIEENYSKGVALKTSSIYRNETSVMVGVKSLNYLENLLEKEKAKNEGYDDALFFNSRGEVCETTSSNIFCVKDGYIITPSLECGLLNGIIRGFIIRNFDVIEKKITRKELMESDEIFITNSVMGLIKVNKIDDRLYNSEKHYFIIREYYEKYIGENGGAKSW